MTQAKLFYFCYFAALCGFNPYLPLHYQAAGLDGQWVGLLAALPPAGLLCCAPLWGLLADATRRHRLMKILSMSGMIASVLLLAHADRLALLLPAITMFAVFAAPVIALTDHETMERLGARRERYGRVRVWGTYGWLLCAPLMGWLAGRFGIARSFLLVALFLTLALLTSLRHAPSTPARLGGFFAGLRRLGGQPGWGWFLLIAGLAGLSLAAVQNFILIRMETLGVSRSWMGVSMSIATISEVPVMLAGSLLLRRLGTRGLLMMALAFCAARSGTSALVGTPEAIVAVQLLHGPSFGMFWVAGVAHARALAPPGLGASAQGLFGGTTTGLGGILGALAGGWLYQHLGGPAMFLVMAMVPLLGLALLWMLPERRWLPAGGPETLPAEACDLPPEPTS